MLPGFTIDAPKPSATPIIILFFGIYNFKSSVDPMPFWIDIIIVLLLVIPFISWAAYFTPFALVAIIIKSNFIFLGI